jgi:hypothetical protein
MTDASTGSDANSVRGLVAAAAGRKGDATVTSKRPAPPICSHFAAKPVTPEVLTLLAFGDAVARASLVVSRPASGVDDSRRKQ